MTNWQKKMRQLVKDAVRDVGGSGGRRECVYCLRDSYEGQKEHYDGSPSEGGPCEALVMQAALNDHAALRAAQDTLKAAIEQHMTARLRCLADDSVRVNEAENPVLFEAREFIRAALAACVPPQETK